MVSGKFFYFDRSIQNKHGVVCPGTFPRKILYLEPKNKEQRKRNKHHDSTDDGYEDDDDLEAMISSLGLQEGLNQNVHQNPQAGKIPI